MEGTGRYVDTRSNIVYAGTQKGWTRGYQETKKIGTLEDE